MAPLKVLAKNANETGVSTRSRNNVKNVLQQAIKAVGKRKAGSPLRDLKTKRAAFGDITNAIGNAVNNGAQPNEKLPPAKITKKKPQENNTNYTRKTLRSHQTSQNKNMIPANNLKKKTNPSEAISLPSSKTTTTGTNAVQSGIDKIIAKLTHTNSSRISDEFDETSLYISAIDISCESKRSNDQCNKSQKEPSLSRDINLLAISDKQSIVSKDDARSTVPEGVEDFDKENWNDPFQVSNYAMHIFEYLKSREFKFHIEDYLPKQPCLTSWMRSLLIDWMVEVQESFELNHETLYLAVKLVDLYLCKKVTKKDELQLLGSASLFIASKYDERTPPMLDDFLYICDGAYTLNQLISMEKSILKTIGFDLGIPISYRFLRRYARCARVTMPTLTLARFILESCLMEYSLISISDSKMAAAALYLAIKMKNLGTWTPTHIYYTGYKLEEILPIVKMQNAYLHKKPKEGLSTVRNKYSHKVFFEVAKITLIANDDLT